MRVLIFSDLHGLSHNVAGFLANHAGYDQTIFAGDFFGYLPGTEEVVRFVRQQNSTFILGNHDLYFLRELFPSEFPKFYGQYAGRMMSATAYQEKYGVLQQTCEQVDREAVRGLLGVPLMTQATIDGLSVTVCHASPRDPMEEYVYPDSPGLPTLFEEFAFDVLVLGHTHVPFISRHEDRCIINPGSCTVPRGNDRKPTVIELETQTRDIRIIEIDQLIQYTRVSKSQLTLQET